MRVEIEQAQMVFRNAGCSPQHAQNIARLTFDYVHQMMVGRRASNVQRLNRIEAAPLRLDLDSMSDHQVARAAARTVFRAVASTARIEPGS